MEQIKNSHNLNINCPFHPNQHIEQYCLVPDCPIRILCTSCSKAHTFHNKGSQFNSIKEVSALLSDESLIGFNNKFNALAIHFESKKAVFEFVEAFFKKLQTRIFDIMDKAKLSVLDTIQTQVDDRNFTVDAIKIELEHLREQVHESQESVDKFDKLKVYTDRFVDTESKLDSFLERKISIPMIDELKYDDFLAKFSGRLDSFIESLFESDKNKEQVPEPQVVIDKKAGPAHKEEIKDDPLQSPDRKSVISFGKKDLYKPVQLFDDSIPKKSIQNMEKSEKIGDAKLQEIKNSNGLLNNDYSLFKSQNKLAHKVSESQIKGIKSWYNGQTTVNWSGQNKISLAEKQELVSFLKDSKLIIRLKLIFGAQYMWGTKGSDIHDSDLQYIFIPALLSMPSLERLKINLTKTPITDEAVDALKSLGQYKQFKKLWISFSNTEVKNWKVQELFKELENNLPQTKVVVRDASANVFKS